MAMERYTTKQSRYIYPASRTHTPERSVAITARDIKMIYEIYRFRYLSTHHLYQLFSFNERSLRNRLTKLYRANYLDKPVCQWTRYADHFNPHVYAIGKRGAQLLEETHQIPARSLYWNGKNDSGSLHIRHTLSIADLLVALQSQCAMDPTVSFYNYAALFPTFPQETQDRSNPKKVVVENKVREPPQPGDIYIHERLTLLTAIPDSIFRLTLSDGTDKNFFYEADRGTEPVHRNDLSQSSIRKKMLVYLTMQKTRLYQSRYNFNNLRVLFVTNSPERVAHLILLNKELTGGKGSNLFLFTDEGALRGFGDVLEMRWTTGKGELVRLLDW